MGISRRQLIVGAGSALPLAALALTRKPDAAPATTSEPARPPPLAPVRAREITSVVRAQQTIEGNGVHVNRALGGRALGMLDPFLLLDEIRSDDPNDYAAGFPDHPHRGFETVTYMIDGAMEHRDSVGNRGRLVAGSAQWMTAGRGIVHSEMPKQERGVMWGFQLWVNLPARSKMMRPRYQDIAPGAIPTVARERATVRVVAGEAFGAVGPVRGIEVAPIFVDVALEDAATLTLDLPREHAAFAYVVEGAVRLGVARREVRRGELAVLSEGDALLASCDAREGGRFLLLAGRPVREPVARYGPFVMTTDAEIRQAIEDYRSGRLVEG